MRTRILSPFLCELCASHEKVGLSTTNLLRFLLRKVFVFFRPARQPAWLPSALLVELRSGAHWGSSWFWVLLSWRRSHRWTQAQIAVTQTRRFVLPVRSSNLSRGRLRGDDFFGLVAQRLVHFPGHPQPMQ